MEDRKQIAASRRIEAAVSAWNKANPPGTPVKLRREPGRDVERVTRSGAWNLRNQAAVVNLEGENGCVPIDVLTPIREAEAGEGGAR